jgi:ribosomal protein S18 acetylase RimI-like enzyme
MQLYTTDTHIDGAQAVRFVGLLDGHIITYATLSLTQYPNAPGQALLADVHVHPAYRGRGWGKMLLQRVLQTAWERQKTVVALHVRYNNWVARALYQRLGFHRYDSITPDGLLSYYYQHQVAAQGH